MTELKAKQIAAGYNKRMRHLYKINEEGKQFKYHSNDVETIMSEDFSDMWEACEPYLDECEHIWLGMKNTDPKLEDVRFPSVGVFSRWGCLKKLYNNIEYYIIKDLHERRKIILNNLDLLEKDYIKTEGYKITPECEFYKGEGIYGEDFPCERKQKELIFTISQQIKDLLKC